jgi:hypothetical protein
MSKFLTFAEAATQIGVHVKTLQKHARQGKLETVDTPFGRRILESALTPYLDCLDIKVGSERSQMEPNGTRWSHLEPIGVEGSQLKDHGGAERIPLESIGSDQGSRLDTKGATWSRVESDGTIWSQNPEPIGAARSRLESTGAEWSASMGTDRRPMESKGAGRSAEEPNFCGEARAEQESVPLSAHLQALSVAQAALDRAQHAELKTEEQRQRAELAERQRTALEVELGRYRLALEEQVSSLIEVRAQALEAEAQLKASHPEVNATEVPVTAAGHSPKWGSRLRSWFGFGLSK